MDKKKLKLSISGDAKKTISNIENAKSGTRNSVIINNNKNFQKKKFYKNPASSDKFKKTVGERQILLAASTHEGEEGMLLAAYRSLLARHPDVDLLIAPRYIERAGRVAELAQQAGFDVAYRSQGAGSFGAVMILDRIGELMSAYALADVVFVGGSFRICTKR